MVRAGPSRHSRGGRATDGRCSRYIGTGPRGGMNGTARASRLPLGQRSMFGRLSDEPRTAMSQDKAVADTPNAGRSDGPAMGVRSDRNPAGTIDTPDRSRSDGHDGHDPCSPGLRAPRPGSVEGRRDLVLVASGTFPADGDWTPGLL